MEVLKKLKKFGIFFGIVILILGIILLIFPEAIMQTIVWVTGIGLLIYGIMQVIDVIFYWKEHGSPIFRLLPGIILIGAGIFVIVNKRITLTAVGIIIGVIAFASAFDRFRKAIERKNTEQKYLSTVLFGLVHVVFGILMIYASFSMISLIIMIIGIYLIAAGIMVILSTGYFFDF